MRTKRLPNWAPPLAFIVALAGVLAVSNRTAPLPQGGKAILNDSDYQSGVEKMQELSENRIRSFEAGEPLTADDKAKLREAVVLLDRLNTYAPLMASLYFISGKIHHILGEDEVAEQMFRQCVLGSPAQAAAQATNAPTINATAAEAAYQLSLLLLARGDVKGALEQADYALSVVPQSSLYHTARGSALNEARRVPEAVTELRQALALDPDNARAASLLKFIQEDAKAGKP